nr:LLM class flavin-dependent oxidoreductase [Amycolatopsis lexingtonensis]
MIRVLSTPDSIQRRSEYCVTTSPVSLPEAPAVAPLRNDNALKLGVFAMNCKGGTTLTKVESGRIVPTWPQQLAIAKAADAAGWEFLLPLARWRGIGGDTDPNSAQFEVFSWAAGITAATERIQVLATAHVPLFEPLVAAKQAATIDHIGHGRFGLNVVSGWNAPEMAMFGKANPPHDERYRIAEEWITLIERLWTETEQFDFEGEFYQAKNAYLAPRPLQQPRPVIVQAGSSPTGMDFAARHADFGFQVHPDLGKLRDMNTNLRKRAEQQGREIGVLTVGTVVCADTEAEAKRYFEHYVDELGDFAAAQNLIDELIGGDNRSWPREQFRAMARGMIAGWGGLQLVGTPEQIVDKLVEVKRSGADGVALSWVDYESGIAQFTEQVQPLLVEAGLRQS